jgi:hypothetical protein
MEKAPGMPAKFESTEESAPNRSTKIQELWRKLFGTEMPEGVEEEEDKRRFPDKEPLEVRPEPKKATTYGQRFRGPSFEPREPGSKYPTTSPAPVRKGKR